MNAFKEAVSNTPYNKLEDSTSVITIKVADRKNSKIIRSCDFAIIYYIDDNPNNGYMYLKNLKNGKYKFEFRKLSIKIADKLRFIEEYEDGWNRVRDEYIKLKNGNNDINKKSFSLYLESVNNVYNKLKPCDPKETSLQCIRDRYGLTTWSEIHEVLR